MTKQRVKNNLLILRKDLVCRSREVGNQRDPSVESTPSLTGPIARQWDQRDPLTSFDAECGQELVLRLGEGTKSKAELIF
jgi:hypothetical protein